MGAHYIRVGMYIIYTRLVITIYAYNLNEIVMENTGYITIVYYIGCIMCMYIYIYIEAVASKYYNTGCSAYNAMWALPKQFRLRLLFLKSGWYEKTNGEKNSCCNIILFV